MHNTQPCEIPPGRIVKKPPQRGWGEGDDEGGEKTPICEGGKNK